MLLLAQNVAVSTPGLATLLSAAYWFGHSVNQIAFRQLSHFNFVADANVLKHLSRMFSTVGSTDVLDDPIHVTGQVLIFVTELALCKRLLVRHLLAAFPSRPAIAKV